MMAYCTQRKTLNVLIIFLFLNFPRISLATPSEALNSAINTPVSILDNFLSTLYARAACYPHYFDESKKSATICMTSIEYNYEDNLITMNFFVDQSDSRLKSFLESKEEVKNAKLDLVMNDLLRTIGIRGDQFDKLVSLIWLTPIRFGWSTKTFDELAFRSEIARRCKVVLHTRDLNTSYSLTRDQHGQTYWKAVQLDDATKKILAKP